jgi:predicted dehydrogenase
MEIYGRKGTLVVSSKISSQHGRQRLQGAQGSQQLLDIVAPTGGMHVPDDFPRGSPYNVGEMYALFAEAVRTGKSPAGLPTFETAVELHHLIDSIKQASDTQQTLPIAK